jgi:hypothetical protein
MAPVRGLLALCLLVALAGVASGCGAGEKKAEAAPARPTAKCSDRAGWQKLANRIGAPVYCPAWMPNPLDAKIGGEWDNGVSVKPDRSYLVSFLWHESQSGDVHVNFRGYPGKTAIPTCEKLDTVNGRARRSRIPCFADAIDRHRVAGEAVTVYAVNQDADQWHILYAWRHAGSLYAVSEHVIRPLNYRKVRRNLDRLVRGLTLLKPKG